MQEFVNFKEAGYKRIREASTLIFHSLNYGSLKVVYLELGFN